MYLPKRRTINCPACDGQTIVDVGGPSPHVHETMRDGKLTHEGITACDGCDALLGFDPKNVEDVWVT